MLKAIINSMTSRITGLSCSARTRLWRSTTPRLPFWSGRQQALCLEYMLDTVRQIVTIEQVNGRAMGANTAITNRIWKGEAGIAVWYVLIISQSQVLWLTSLDAFRPFGSANWRESLSAGQGVFVVQLWPVLYVHAPFPSSCPILYL